MVLQEIDGAALFLAAIRRSQHRDHRAGITRRTSPSGRDISDGDGSYLTFQGLTFTGTYRTLFSKPYEFLLQGDWAIARTGAVFMTNAENIRVDSCLFDQIGGNGVFMSGHNRNNAVVNSDFEDAGASCVAMVGLQSAVRCAATAYGNAPSCSDKTPGPQTDDYPASNLVENNTMNNFGRFEKQVAGVEMSMTSKNTVRHNTIHTMPRAGINFNDGCWGGHLIEWNWVYNAVLETSDHGPLNAWGRDRNLIFQSDPTATKLDAVDTTTIQNNRFEIASPMFGIDLDDQSSNYLQQNNLLIGGGLKVQWSRDNTYENNILVNGAVVDVHSPWAQNGHVVKNNIIVGNVAYSFYGINSLTTNIVSTGVTIDYNLFYNSGQDPHLCQWLKKHLPFHLVTVDSGRTRCPLGRGGPAVHESDYGRLYCEGRLAGADARVQELPHDRIRRHVGAPRADSGDAGVAEELKGPRKNRDWTPFLVGSPPFAKMSPGQVPVPSTARVLSLRDRRIARLSRSHWGDDQGQVFSKTCQLPGPVLMISNLVSWLRSPMRKWPCALLGKQSGEASPPCPCKALGLQARH